MSLDFLLKKYGIYLTLENLAEIINRKPRGLRGTLQNENDELSKLLLPAKKRIGRRVIFNTEIVAKQLGLGGGHD